MVNTVPSATFALLLEIPFPPILGSLISSSPLVFAQIIVLAQQSLFNIVSLSLSQLPVPFIRSFFPIELIIFLYTTKIHIKCLPFLLSLSLRVKQDRRG